MSKKLILILTLVGLTTCQPKGQLYDMEPWVEKPISEWPDIALTNSIQFSDTSYNDIANAFLVDTGKDTLAASCKHIFMVFQKSGLKYIDLGNNFVRWTMYPKAKKNETVAIRNLINVNRNEAVGKFNTLKVRDWIIFRLASENNNIYPLKLRTKPLEKNEVVHAIGWAFKQKSKTPTKIKLQVYQNLGKYCYVTTLTQNVDPRGRSGSPVLDSNGHLVGLISGAEGNLGVISTTEYLLETLEKYNILYAE